MSYAIDPSLPASCVGLLAWADATDKSFYEADLDDRFPILDDSDGARNPLLFWIPKLVDLGYLSQDVDIHLNRCWKYLRPASDAAIPEQFKRACKKYPGKKDSVTFVWGRFKKHKDWKACLLQLEQAIDAQIASREIAMRRPGVFVAPWKNLSTWINQRCWEEVPEFTPAANVEINQEYKSWLIGKFGITAVPVLSPMQYDTFMNSKGEFAGMSLRISKTNMFNMLETAHIREYNGSGGGQPPYEYLVALYNQARK